MEDVLEIKDLVAEIDGKKILDGVNLIIKKGEIHAIMGPNGSGKSTLARIIMGDFRYKITSGDILLNGKSIKELPPEERSKLGIFMSFQQPIEVSGLKLFTYLKTIYSIHNDQNISFQDFIKYIQEKANNLRIDSSILSRNLNEGFSGGERKKIEILQMLLVRPKFSIIDEIDSGLDVDSLELVAKSINDIYKNELIGIILITHYMRILKYVKPSYVHVLMDGKIVKSGDYSLALEIEEKGYEWIREKMN
ncbi:MAG: Fe-S cluster assembly ATPase SufC [Thermoplasmata archaeon]|jgi:Fe-S cluster assembly ATP-binding protein